MEAWLLDHVEVITMIPLHRSSWTCRLRKVGPVVNPSVISPVIIRDQPPVCQ